MDLSRKIINHVRHTLLITIKHTLSNKNVYTPTTLTNTLNFFNRTRELIDLHRPRPSDYITAWLIVLLVWLKTRTAYSTNSWIYTTNHKRISVNYFNFVLVSGTAGMSLATVIRLEFAYPGVGVLAGDSLQYLCIATAHGVIMVFFMIMPLIFGAFGNFLLPTQLGVHDVAFPRLNSAAFWFLPGGLIMLCQLVCIDRRYQRMNCFNIRELQGILKRRFFTDLVNTSDFRDLLDESIVGLRFKAGNQFSTTSNTVMFYRYGMGTEQYTKNTRLVSAVLFHQEANLNNPVDSFFISLLSNTLYNSDRQLSLRSFSYQTSNLLIFVKNTISSLPSPADMYIIDSLTPQIKSAALILSTNTIQTLLTAVSNIPYYLTSMFGTTHNIPAGAIKSGLLSEGTVVDSTATNSDTSAFRFTRFGNTLVQYDYKCGNYIGGWDKLYPSLITSYLEVARGIRKPSWLFAEDLTSILKSNFTAFTLRFTTPTTAELSEVGD